MGQAGTLKPAWLVSVKQETSDTRTDTWQGDSVKTQRAIWEPSGSQGLPEATRSWDRGTEQTLPWSVQRERGPASLLVWDFRPLKLRPRISAVLSLPGCGTSLQRPQETNTR